MALYRFSCDDSIIDEREFYSGEDVYTHAQYLANEIGHQVDFAVMPTSDSVKPQLGIEPAQHEQWQIQPDLYDDWEIEPDHNQDWNLEPDLDGNWNVDQAQNANRPNFMIAVIIGIASGIAGMTAVGVYSLGHQTRASLDKTESTEFLHQQSTPAPIFKTKDDHLTRVGAMPIISGTKGTNSRKFARETSGMVSTRQNSGSLEDEDLVIPSDSQKLTTHRRQSAAADSLPKMPADTRKESSSLRAKNLTKSKASNQLKRQKKQSASGSEGLGNEATSPRQLTPNQAAASAASKKLPGGGF